MTNNIIKNAVEKMEAEIYIYDNNDGSYGIIEETEYICQHFAILGNRHYSEINADVYWLEDVKHLITDIQCYIDTEDDEDVRYLASLYDISEARIRSVIDIINKYSNPESVEAIVDILNVITDNTYDCETIRGYCQGDWNYVIYNADEVKEADIRYIEAIYFGMYSDVKIKTQDNEYWDFITHNELWKLKDNHDEICQRFDLPITSKVYFEDGKITTTKWKEA